MSWVKKISTMAPAWNGGKIAPAVVQERGRAGCVQIRTLPHYIVRYLR